MQHMVVLRVQGFIVAGVNFLLIIVFKGMFLAIETFEEAWLEV
jgi:hypothetical protein